MAFWDEKDPRFPTVTLPGGGALTIHRVKDDDESKVFLSLTGLDFSRVYIGNAEDLAQRKEEALKKTIDFLESTINHLKKGLPA